MPLQLLLKVSIATSEVRNSVSNTRPLILQKGQKCFLVHSSLFDACNDSNGDDIGHEMSEVASVHIHDMFEHSVQT